MDRTTHGGKYFITFIDDFSRMTSVYFMRQKSDVFSIFWKFQSLERQSGHLTKVLRSDICDEYNSNEFMKFCEDIGMERQLTVGYTPQQNGVVERKTRTIENVKINASGEGIAQDFFGGKTVNDNLFC